MPRSAQNPKTPRKKKVSATVSTSRPTKPKTASGLKGLRKGIKRIGARLTPGKVLEPEPYEPTSLNLPDSIISREDLTFPLDESETVNTGQPDKTLFLNDLVSDPVPEGLATRQILDLVYLVIQEFLINYK